MAGDAAAAAAGRARRAPGPQSPSPHRTPPAPQPPPSPHPQERYISIKIFYYDDLVPADYQPPHFVDATTDEHAFFPAPPLKVNLGTVASVRRRATLPARRKPG